MTATREDQIIFAVSPGQGDGIPVVVLGIPAAAWEYMRDGKTHTFDLTKAGLAGLQVKIMVFGADTGAAALKMIEEASAATGLSTLDRRRDDFGMKPPR